MRSHTGFRSTSRRSSSRRDVLDEYNRLERASGDAIARAARSGNTTGSKPKQEEAGPLPSVDDAFAHRERASDSVSSPVARRLQHGR